MSKAESDAAMQQEGKSSAAVIGQKETDAGADLPVEKKFSTERLLKSKQLAAYQPDFARAVLTEPAYSVSGAKRVLDAALKGGKK